ncbi:hypothetical protein FH968_23290 [Buttiauxella sp. B2]|uniref:hypothetical protein n=1 Tax=Buttiauxella sp. B2 TaxID=2587812 RepID=UPI001123496C|nr:hypothetical protein [Buttiauxella sp. B2]TNV09568.1 hypothetical protein FH968_23290 [Buttiauxella sp. B2]
MSDWTELRNAAIEAAKKELTGQWGIVSNTLVPQIENLARTAYYIEQNKDKMTDDERENLLASQKFAMEITLTSYAHISSLIARKIINDVIDVLVKGIPKLVVGLIF